MTRVKYEMNCCRLRLSKHTKAFDFGKTMSELDDSQADSQSTSVTYGNIEAVSPTGAVRNLAVADLEESTSASMDLSPAFEEMQAHPDASLLVIPSFSLTAPVSSKVEPIDFDVLKVKSINKWKNQFIDDINQVDFESGIERH